MNSTAKVLSLKTENLNSITAFSIPFPGWFPVPIYGVDYNTGVEYESEDLIESYAMQRCEEDIKNNRLLTIDEVFGKLGV